MDVDVSTSVAGNKPQRIRRIQTVTLVLLFMAGIVNFLDRSSLSVAGEAIRGELGLSATEFGVLLSAFSLSYGFSQLPSGILLDRFGPRIVLGAGLIFWSLMQALTGMVNSFSHFILMRIGLGIGEAPFMPAGVKSITDWYAQKERGTALGIFNSSTVIGQDCASCSCIDAAGMGLAGNVRHHRRGGDSGWDLLVRVVSQPGAVCPDRRRTDLSLRAG